MVLIAQDIDANWELQMRVLCFSHTPPPRSGKILAKRLFNIWCVVASNQKKTYTPKNTCSGMSKDRSHEEYLA